LYYVTLQEGDFIGEKGVYLARKKNNDIYYRASFTYRNKHISLGSFDDEAKANKAYLYACELSKSQSSIEDYDSSRELGFDKYIVIINFRDNNIYIPNPIYLRRKYFSYFLSIHEEMKFSMDDLFYYISHKILRRGGHLYVNDYGMQFSLHQRYGIKNYGIAGKDYCFVNGDELDYRYENIAILNSYHGVSQCIHNKKHCYKAKIHVNGDYIVGYYDDALKAAIAYNKAVDLLKKNGIDKNYSQNYIDSLSGKIYADIYSEVEISQRLIDIS